MRESGCANRALSTEIESGRRLALSRPVLHRTDTYKLVQYPVNPEAPKVSG